MDKETVTFLIVDDDEVAVMAIRRALNKMRFVNPVEVVGDGQEALDLLRGSTPRRWPNLTSSSLISTCRAWSGWSFWQRCARTRNWQIRSSLS